WASAVADRFTERAVMIFTTVEQIADAVLYEGYLLYPYRASALKNRQRWAFGVLVPFSYSQATDGAEAWAMQTECLVAGQPRTTLDVKGRFLQEVTERTVPLTAELGPIVDQPQRLAFVLPTTPEQSALEGAVELRAERLDEEVFRVTVRIENRTPVPGD